MSATEGARGSLPNLARQLEAALVRKKGFARQSITESEKRL